MKDATELIRALTGLAWPVFAAWVVWKLLPEIRDIVKNRAFSLKVGNNELTVQQFTDQVVETTAELQRQVTAQAEPAGSAQRVLRRILWVDDAPSNNAYQAAQLQAMGVEVVQAESTDEGLKALRRAQRPFDAVISDMGRAEADGFNPDAGLALIRKIRETDATTPVFVYGGSGAMARRDRVAAAGGNGVTQSPTELFALLGEVGRFPRTAT
ncbi:PleD family two-component system response regulator [Streptomyces sp. NPDC051016]|uniref:PleD family two-component system response regulator n=1 Tax=Streptomyces sp. NPDC051016 TaxID=3365638 RepID=UPI0037A6E871